MRKIYFCLLAFLIMTPWGFSQHFRKGFDITYNATGTIPGRDLNFGNFPGVTNDYFTGGTTACSGGTKHLTKIKGGGLSQSMLNLDNGQALDIDFGAYPYATIRVQSTANTDIQMRLTIRGNPDMTRNFTIKGNNTWNTIRLDFSDQKGDPSGTSNELHWGWTEPIGTNYPYELYFDYVRLGGIDDKGAGASLNTGDPDSTIKMALSSVPDQTCEKEGGQQTINLSGITNGTDVTGLTLSQTNTKPTLFESITFGTIQPDGTCTMNYTPKTGQIGMSNVHLVLTYNRGDSVIKYKSVWFNISITTDPSMKVATAITAQINQPKVTSKLTAITNSIGSTNKLLLEVKANNPELITNLKVDPIKSDGTSNLSFIPGTDKCGQDTITLTLTDSTTNRSKQYQIPVDVVPCEPKSINMNETGELVFTNPASDDKLIITIPSEQGGRLALFDLTGRNLIERVVPAGQSKVEILISQLNSGIYFIVFERDNQKLTRKLIVK